MKTSISVPEMYTMLGISKVSGYDLLKQGFFKTIPIAGHTRILLDSFNEWYDHQICYHKVNGPPPGQALKEKYLTELEVQKLLGVSESTAYELVRKGYFETVPIERRKWLIDREGFEEWYASQVHYCKKDGPPPGTNQKPSYSLREVRLLLGLKKRDKVYALIKKQEIDYWKSEAGLELIENNSTPGMPQTKDKSKNAVRLWAAFLLDKGFYFSRLIEKQGLMMYNENTIWCFSLRDSVKE